MNIFCDLEEDTRTCTMPKLSCGTLSLFLVLQAYRCDGVTVTMIKANRLASYDGHSCPIADLLFVQADVRTKIECVSYCSKLSDCACVFYKHGYCSGCNGICHYGATLLALTGTAYYYIKERIPAISLVEGAIAFGNKYYLISQNMTTWQDALNYCNSLQATLIYVETQSELDFIATQLNQSYYWSEGIFADGQYVWSHSGAPVDMTLFGSGQPSSNKTCVGLWQPRSYQLDDALQHWGLCNLQILLK